MVPVLNKVEYPAFVSKCTIKETTGNIDCEGCARSFLIQQISSSNLFMVVVDNKCDCSSAPLVSMDPIEIISTAPPTGHSLADDHTALGAHRPTPNTGEIDRLAHHQMMTTHREPRQQEQLAHN
ncbi:unnamed protein product [Coregonus sp. 'balchen']|nr:unnamed protein product [Coregonus sp. 'balchen']